MKKRIIAWLLIGILLMTSAIAFAKAFHDASESPISILGHWWGIIPFVPLTIAIVIALLSYNRKDD